MPGATLEFHNRRGGSWLKKQRTHSEDLRIKVTRISSYKALGPLLTAKATNRVEWLKGFLMSLQDMSKETEGFHLGKDVGKGRRWSLEVGLQ